MIEIIDLSAEHYPELANFLAGFNDDAESADRWLACFSMWWQHNPAADKTQVYGWLLTDNMAIVGFIGVIPSRFQLQDKEITAFNATTWRVKPEYRSHSIKLLLKIISLSRQGILFNTSPIPHVVPILEKLHFKKVPSDTVEHNRNSIVILNSQKLLKHRLRNQKILHILLPLFAPILTLVQKLKLKLHLSQDYVCKQLKTADTSFDELWQSSSKRYANTTVRDAISINWFCSGVNTQKMQLFACYKAERLMGFAIFCARKDSRSDKLECIDIWLRDDNNESRKILQSLILLATQYAKQHAFDLLLIPHFNHAISCDLKKLGLLQVNISENREYFLTDAATSQTINSHNTYISHYQGDTIYF